MRALDRKLLRDLARMWAQALAIALVMGAGVATLILAVGMHRSLTETRAAYYERYRFADVFAAATRAPEELEQAMARIPGVAAVETRISRFALLDIEGFAQPATASVLSLPDFGPPRLNRLYLRTGRLPEPFSEREVVINEAFARAHGFSPGARFHAILNGRKRELTVVGVALSPEFIYALGPGDFIPDDARFGVVWMSEKALASIFDLDGAFNSVSVKLMRGASEQEAIKRIDDLLAPFGGEGAYGRRDHPSHAFLDAELKQLEAMARILPPIFIAVAAVLVNMILSRLIALEREQIGLLKAVGYGRLAIATHYVKLALAIALAGIVLGAAGGVWLGRGLTELYADFFHFPFLIFRNTPDVFIIAGGVAVAAALVGAVRSVARAMALPPAVAMAPPAPTRYRRLWTERLGLTSRFSQITMMALRHIVRWPLRAGLTSLGIAMAVAIMVSSLWALGAVDFMIDVAFFRSDRQDATLTFVDERPADTVNEAARLPGVMRAEPYRTVAAKLGHGHYERRISLTGRPVGADLSRLLDVELNPVALPPFGLVLSKKLAELVRAGVGDRVVVQMLEGRRARVEVPVVARVETYLGLAALMEIDALNALMDEGPLISGVNLSVDENENAALYGAVKALPSVSAIALQKASLAKFRDTLAENILVMITTYVSLGAVIAFGVVYNSARIQLSERARELASLRVLGFTRAEVSWVLLGELAILTAVAMPVGCAIGTLLAWFTALGLDTELYRVPFVIERSAYAWAMLVVLAASILSALAVRRRIDHLDLIAVLKTRE